MYNQTLVFKNEWTDQNFEWIADVLKFSKGLKSLGLTKEDLGIDNISQKDLKALQKVMPDLIGVTKFSSTAIFGKRTKKSSSLTSHVAKVQPPKSKPSRFKDLGSDEFDAFRGFLNDDEFDEIISTLKLQESVVEVKEEVPFQRLTMLGDNRREMRIIADEDAVKAKKKAKKQEYKLRLYKESKDKEVLRTIAKTSLTSVKEVDVMEMDKNLKLIQKDTLGPVRQKTRGTSGEDPKKTKKRIKKLASKIEKESINSYKQRQVFLRSKKIKDVVPESWMTYNENNDANVFMDSTGHVYRFDGKYSHRVYLFSDLYKNFFGNDCDAMDMIDATLRNVVPAIKYMVNKLGNYVSYIYSLCRCRNVTDFVAFTTLFCQTLPAGLVEIALARCLNIIYECGSRIKKVFSREIEVIPESFSDKFNEAKFYFANVVHSDIAKMIKKLVLSIASYQWFSKDTAVAIYKIMGKPEKRSVVDLIEDTLDGLSTLARYGELWCDGNSIMDIIKSNDPVLTCYNKINDLLFYDNKTYTGLKVPGKKSMLEYMQEANDLINVSDKLLKSARPLDDATILLKRIGMRLKTSLQEKVQIRNAHNRQTPFAVLLSGTPGIGKSVLLDHFYKIWSHANGRKFHKGMVYTKSNTSQYNDGYDSLSHDIIHFPEVGSKSDSLLEKSGDTVINELCAIIDAQPYAADVAFEDKGKVFFSPGLVAIDTNDPEMGLSKLLRNPAAVRRRFLYIQASVMPQYRKLNSNQIDSKKSLEAKDTLPMDRWMFTVKTQEAVDLKISHVDPLLVGGSIYELTDLLLRLFITHIDTQNKISNAYEHVDIEDYISKDIKNFNMGVEQLEVIPESLDLIKAYANVVKVGIWSKLGAFIPHVWMILVATWSLLACTGELFLAIFASPRSQTVHTVEIMLYFISSFFAIKLDRSLYFWPFLCGSMWYARSHEWFAVFILYEQRKHVKNKLQAKWNDLMYLFGRKIGNYNAFAGEWFKINGSNLLGAVAVLVCVVKLFRVFKKSKVGIESSLDVDDKDEHEVVEEEAISVYPVKTNALEVMNGYERKLDCGSSLIRHKINQSELWNSQFPSSFPAIHKGSLSSLNAAIARNVRKVSIFYKDNVQKQYMLGLCENFAIVNTHALDGECTVVSVSKNNEWDDIKDQVKDVTELNKSNTYDLGNDITLIRLGNERFQNIMMHVMVDDLTACSKPGFFFGEEIRSHLKDKDPINFKDKHGAYVMDRYWVYNYVNHIPGMCGQPLLVQKNSGCCVSGLHCGGIPGSNAYATVLDKRRLDVAINILKTRNPVLNVTSECWKLPNLVGPIRKSPVFYEVLHGLKYLGKVDKPILMNQKSRLITTVGCENYVSLFRDKLNFVPSVEYGPPLMGKTFINGEYLSPWNVGLRKMSKQKGNVSNEVLQIVGDRLVKYVVEGLAKRGITRAQPLSMDDAINGADEDDFISRINASTAGGFGFAGCKSKFLPVNVLEEARVQRLAVDDLINKVNDRIDSYSRGESYGIIHEAKLKDEPREKSKILSGKTRIFYPTPLDVLVLSRMLLGPIYSTMVQHCDLFGGAIGINMHSDADAFIKSMKEFSDKFMNGDYGFFDLGIPVEIHVCANYVVEEVCKALGYNTFALNLLRYLQTDLVYPLVLILTDLFVVAGLTVSGSYGTAERNTLLNLILMMVFWYSMDETKILDFFEYVCPRNYGDDVNTAVKESVSHVFNNIGYKYFVENMYKMEYTSATKIGELKKFDSLESLSFLKRKFVFREDLDIYVAQLDMNSILKSLMWYIPSKFVTREEQMISTVTSALWELAIHLEENKFNEMRFGLMNLLDDEFKIVSGPSLPTFEHIVSVIRRDVVQKNSVRTLPTIFPESFTPVMCGPELREEEESKASDGSFFGKHGDSLNIYSFPVLHRDRTLSSESISKLQWRSNEIRPRSVATVVKIQQKLVELHNTLKISQRELADLDDGFKNYSRYALSLKLCTIHDADIVKRMQKRLLLMANISSMQISISRFEDVLARIVDVLPEADSSQSNGLITDMVKNENMEDAPGSEMKMENAGHTVNSQQGQRNILGMENFLSRPVQIYSAQLAATTDIEIRLAVWDLFFAAPTIRAKVRNHAYLRGNLHTRVVVSGTPFHYGRLLASYQPYATRNDNIVNMLANVVIDPTFRPLFINYLSQALGSSVINVNENKPLDLECPFISSKPMHRLYNAATTAIAAGTSFDDMIDAGDLFIYSINQIKAVSATPSPVYIQVYAWMDDVELGTNTATQLAITTESMDERRSGPVETIASRIYSVASALQDAAVIGPYARASAAMAFGISRVAAIFGWSRPVKEVVPTYVKSLPLMNSAHTIGFDTPFRITLDPHQELSVDPRITGIEDDEMALNVIANRVSYFETFAWLDNDPALGAPIWAVRVTPCSVTNVTIGTKVYSQPTAMAFAAFPFQYWRGSITYRIEVVCSAFHRGKLAIYYEPNISQISLISPTLELNKQFLEVIDIQETQVFEVTLNWASYRPWLLVNTSAGAYINNVDPENVFQSVGYCNGFLAITPFTELQSPDSSDIQLNVYTYSSDLALSGLTSANFHTERKYPVVPAGFAEVIPESNSSNSSAEVSIVDLNLSSASTEHISEEYFGERPISFRTLLKRYVTNNVVTYAADATALPKYMKFVDRCFPVNNCPYGSTTFTYTELFSYLYYAYLGIKGSVRYRIHPTNGMSISPYHQFKVTLDAPSNSFSTPSTSWTSGTFPSRLAGTVSYVPQTQGGIEYELPYFSSNLFQLSFTSTLQGNVGNDDWCPTYYRNYSFTVESGATSTGAGSVNLEVASGEDFSFLRFQGAPYYSGDPIA